jgi:hypothetical protein
MSYSPVTSYSPHGRHQHCESGGRITEHSDYCASYDGDVIAEASSSSDKQSPSSSASVDEDDAGPEYRSLHYEKSRGKPRENGKRDQNVSGNTNTGISQSDIITIVGMLCGLVLTGGIGSISVQIAAAGLRLATMTAYVGATGAAAVGTGYVAMKGGKLVIQKAKPGVIMTVRAASRVSRDCRTGALAASQAVVDAAGAVQSGVISQAQTVANASNDVRNQAVSGSEALMARLFNLPTQISNILLRSTAPGQESLAVRVLSEEEAQAHLQGGIDPNVNTFIVQQLADGTTSVQRVVRNGDLGDALWTVSSTNQPQQAHSEENEDDFVDVQAQTAITSSDDSESISDRVSFETARETASVAVGDIDGDYEIC